MARLPVVGADGDNWGALLNEFLAVAHHADGTLRSVAGVVNVRDYGASGDGINNDFDAVQMAISIAAPGSVIYFPPGRYLLRRTYTAENPCTEILLINKLLHLRGAGGSISAIVGRVETSDTKMASQVDIVRIDIKGKTPAESQMRFLRIEDIAIYPSGYCRHVINIDVKESNTKCEEEETISQFSEVNNQDTFRERPYCLQVQANMLIQGCQLVSSANPEGYAIYLTNTHSDGFFASHINRNYILGGIYLKESGDSIWITYNLISDQPEPGATGKKTGITLINDIGAVSSVIAYNNITSYGGAINIIRGSETKILYNQLEAREKINEDINNTDALLSIQGDSAKPDQCSQIDIIGNNINPNDTVGYTIYLGYATETVIENNLLVSGQLRPKEELNEQQKRRHIKISEYAKDTRIGFNTWVNWGNYHRMQPEIDDAGTGTIHLYTSEGKLQFYANALSFFGAPPAKQQGSIALSPGGETVDVEARTAISQILAALKAYGLIA